MAIPNDSDLSMFERGGSGPSTGKEQRGVSFVSLDAPDLVTGEPAAERYMAHAEHVYGSAKLWHTEQAVLWAHIGRLVAAMPRRGGDRAIMEVFAECADTYQTQRATGATIRHVRTVIGRFCRKHGIDRARLLRRDA